MAALDEAQAIFEAIGERRAADMTELERAQALAVSGRVEAAQAMIDGALQRHRAAQDGLLSNALHVAGTVNRLAGRSNEAAVRLQQESLAALKAELRATAHGGRRLTELGLALLALGRFGTAEDILLQAIAALQTREGRITPTRADALSGLGRARLAAGRGSEALQPLAQADAFWREFEPGSRWAAESAAGLARCRAALGSRMAGMSASEPPARP